MLSSFFIYIYMLAIQVFAASYPHPSSIELFWFAKMYCSLHYIQTIEHNFNTLAGTGLFLAPY